MSNGEEQKDQHQAGREEPGEVADMTDTAHVEPDLRERLEEAEREKEQFKKLAQRAQADLVNFRNRVRDEQETIRARAVIRVASRFIEVSDQLEKALAGDAAEGVDRQWVNGVEAIYLNLQAVLKSEGFERFDADGEDFDPRLHDALFASESSEHRPNRVIRQLAAGYTRHGDVIRPAQVEIAKPPESAG